MSGKGETKLIFPGLADFYASVSPIAYALVRVVVGIMFLMHVSGKFKVGAAAVAANVMSKNGLEPSFVFAYAVIVLETVGGVCLVIGLFTRLLLQRSLSRWPSRCCLSTFRRVMPPAEGDTNTFC